jgi:DNA-binding NtrC family response regulator
MQELFKLIGRSADSSATVLITGPSGVGKELVAKAFHQNSSRSKANFITVNCAAIPADLLESELFGYVKGAFTGAEESRKGKFLSADGGTILLDEVGDMSLPLQAKMLRVLQEREVYPVGAVAPVKVDVRVLAATNRDLVSDVNEGRFREDLYHRLNVVHVSLPPLSARKDDIPLLVNHFLRVDAKGRGEPAKTMAGSAIDILCAYNWPGNVRELENCVRRALLMAPGKVITPDHLPPELLDNRSEGNVDLAE